jgi:adenosylhomocysteine nucleosidase
VLARPAVGLALLLTIACGTAHRAASSPVVVMISAEAEWKPIRALLADPARADTPFGEWLVHRFGARDVIVFHGGFGKVAAAAAAQYAVQRWHPRLIVNLGTCGGFGPTRKVGDVVLASQTIIYDLVEQMGDPDETIRHYTTAIDTARWPSRLSDGVAIEPIVSGDRDLVASELPALAAKYHASVGDWESGAIAWTAHQNGTPVLILRAVTDLVDATGKDVTYGDDTRWQREAAQAMGKLVELFAAALPDL